MTIENELKRIADALEALVSYQGIVPESQPELPEEEIEEEELEEELEEEELEEEELEDDLDELEEEELEEEPAPVKKTKKKAAKKAKKKTAKKSRVGKKSAPPESDYTADEVRGKLKDLQMATGSAAQAKSILKKNGASTFGQLKVNRYDRVVAAVDKLLED